MIKIALSEIAPAKIKSDPLPCLVDCNFKVIQYGFVYQFIKNGWVLLRKSKKSDLKTIPIITEEP